MARTVCEIKQIAELYNIIKNAFQNPTLCHNSAKEVKIHYWDTICTVEILCAVRTISTMISGSVTTAYHALRFRMEERPPIWRVAANILIKQCRQPRRGSPPA